MDFSAALLRIKEHFKLTRRGWNAPGQFVVIQAGYPDGIAINHNTAQATGLPVGTLCKFNPYFMIYGVDGSFSPWVPSVGDLLADDWQWLAEDGQPVPAMTLESQVAPRDPNLGVVINPAIQLPPAGGVRAYVASRPIRDNPQA